MDRTPKRSHARTTAGRWRAGVLGERSLMARLPARQELLASSTAARASGAHAAPSTARASVPAHALRTAGRTAADRLILVMRAGLTLYLAAAIACVDPLTSNVTSTPEWDLRNTERYAQAVTGQRPDTAYGWGLAIEGDMARWRQCSGPRVCGETERLQPKVDILAIEKVGTVEAGDGGTVDVLKLTLAPRRGYVVPYVNPVKANAP